MQPVTSPCRGCPSRQMDSLVCVCKTAGNSKEHQASFYFYLLTFFFNLKSPKKRTFRLVLTGTKLGSALQLDLAAPRPSSTFSSSLSPFPLRLHASLQLDNLWDFVSDDGKVHLPVRSYGEGTGSSRPLGLRHRPTPWSSSWQLILFPLPLLSLYTSFLLFLKQSQSLGGQTVTASFLETIFSNLWREANTRHVCFL